MGYLQRRLQQDHLYYQISAPPSRGCQTHQIREVCVHGAPKAHDAAELLFGAPKAPVICNHFVKYAEQQSRSDCQPILLNKQSHSREATVVRSVAKRLFKYAEPQSRSDCQAAPTRRSRQYVHKTLMSRYKATFLNLRLNCTYSAKRQ